MAIINLYSACEYDTIDGVLTRIEPSPTTFTPWFADEAQATSHSHAGSGIWGKRKENGEIQAGYTTYLSHVGLCLFDWERNGYDDSDFYMAVWNPIKGEREDICFASTRGWSYPCYGSKPDATPEVRAAHDAWRDQLKAHDEAARKAKELAAKQALELEFVALAKIVGCTPARVQALQEAMGDQYEACVKLLKTKAFRSSFRASLCQQIKTWLMDENPAHAAPLSYKQRQYL